MKCILCFGITSMKEDTSAQLSGGGKFMGGWGYHPSYFEKVYTKLQKSNKKDYVSANINKGLSGGGLAWIKYPKKDMAVTFSYCSCLHSQQSCRDAGLGVRPC